MNGNTEIGKTISSLVSEELKIPAEEITPGTNLRELPGVESIKVLRIIAKIERLYDVELDDELVFRVKTIQELAEAIEQIREEQA